MSDEKAKALNNLIHSSDNLLNAMQALDSRVGLGCCNEKDGWCTKCLEASTLAFYAKAGWEYSKKQWLDIK